MTEIIDHGVVPIGIRRVRQEDLPAIVALDAEITGVAKPDYWSDAFTRYGRHRPKERAFLVAETRDEPPRVVGAIAGEVRAWEFGSPPCGWLFSMQVVPDARQGKIATRLFDELRRFFQANGADTVRTMVARDNHLMLSFLRSQGLRGGPYLQLEMEIEPDLEAVSKAR